jgi:hypothetical protein
MAPPPSLVNETTKRTEKLRHAVDFVKNDKSVFVLAQKEGWVSELTPVLGRLEVKVERWDLFGQSKR